jgi:hypothetical protein
MQNVPPTVVQKSRLRTDPFLQKENSIVAENKVHPMAPFALKSIL